jgi:glycosyltransferase involved in cell wall biosynthesis
MVIWLYGIFSNEAQLLPYFLRHYAPQVDRLILFDNCSTDGSADLIRAYDNATIEKYPANAPVMDSVNMEEFSVRRYIEAREKADWVIWVDCDEFLWNGPLSLRTTLRDYQARGWQAIKTCGYQMVSNHLPTATDKPITDQIQYGFRDTEYDKMIVFNPALSVRWKPGRHSYRVAGTVVYQDTLRLLHYRFLGVDYFKRRNAYNAANRSAAEIASNRSYAAAPDYVSGKYSLAWYQQWQAYATDVINYNFVEVQE